MGPGLGARRGKRHICVTAGRRGGLQWGRAWGPGGATEGTRRETIAYELHWGRAWGPGGAPGLALERRDVLHASMGPGLGARRGQNLLSMSFDEFELQWGRAWGPGGAAVQARYDEAVRDLLQWGRAWGPGGARSTPGTPRPTTPRFNGAGLGGPEGRRQRDVSGDDAGASMGPGLGARRGRHGSVCTSPSASCFNGAGLGGPEGRARCTAMDNHTLASMGPGLGARRGLGVTVQRPLYTCRFNGAGLGGPEGLG